MPSIRLTAVAVGILLELPKTYDPLLRDSEKQKGIPSLDIAWTVLGLPKIPMFSTPFFSYGICFKKCPNLQVCFSLELCILEKKEVFTRLLFSSFFFWERVPLNRKIRGKRTLLWAPLYCWAVYFFILINSFIRGLILAITHRFPLPKQNVRDF